MGFNKYPRRAFFKESCFMAAIPAVLSSFISLSKDAGTKNKLAVSSVPDASDLDRIRELLKQKAPVKWLFTGDSITAGVGHTHGYRSYPEIFGERIRMGLQHKRDIVINTGVSGDTSQDILDDFDWRITQFKPAVVSLMIGTNDCAKKEMSTEIFEANLNTLLIKIRKLGAIAILQTPNMIIVEKAPERTNLFDYIAVIQNIAKKGKLILVDNWTYWRETLQIDPEVNVFKNWLNDPLHPNGTGHSEIARLMFKELSIFDPADPTCGGKYYEGEH